MEVGETNILQRLTFCNKFYENPLVIESYRGLKIPIVWVQNEAENPKQGFEGVTS